MKAIAIRMGAILLVLYHSVTLFVNSGVNATFVVFRRVYIVGHEVKACIECGLLALILIWLLLIISNDYDGEFG